MAAWNRIRRQVTHSVLAIAAVGAVGGLLAGAAASPVAAAQQPRVSEVAANAQPNVPELHVPFYLCANLASRNFCLSPTRHGSPFTINITGPRVSVSYTNPYYYAGHDWYELEAGGLCLNWDPTAGNQPVYADSCVPGDLNELWSARANSTGTEWFNLHGNIGYGRDTFLQPYATLASSDIFVGANTDFFDEWTEPAA
jgi:hypothetical protein